MKKFLAAILTVAFVVGIIANFSSVAEAMMPNMWKCLNCGKKVQSKSEPFTCPMCGKTKWIYIGDDY